VPQVSGPPAPAVGAILAPFLRFRSAQATFRIPNQEKGPPQVAPITFGE